MSQFSVPPGSSFSASGSSLVVKNPAGQAVASASLNGLFYISANDVSIIIGQVYATQGSMAYIDTGLRQYPAPGQYYFFVGSAFPAVWLCPQSGLSQSPNSLPASAYGILNAVSIQAG